MLCVCWDTTTDPQYPDECCSTVARSLRRSLGYAATKNRTTQGNPRLALILAQAENERYHQRVGHFFHNAARTNTDAKEEQHLSTGNRP
ncbi:hypothetical protein SRHO_G00229890 [Serrasalmus rhombeus]